MSNGVDATCAECGGKIYRVEPIDGLPEVETWCHYHWEDNLKPPANPEDETQLWHVIRPVDLVDRPSVEELMEGARYVPPEPTDAT